MTIQDHKFCNTIITEQHTKCETYIKDIHFLSVALNLSKKRDALEKKAMHLIDKVGYIKALKISNENK